MWNWLKNSYIFFQDRIGLMLSNVLNSSSISDVDVGVQHSSFIKLRILDFLFVFNENSRDLHVEYITYIYIVA